MKKKKKNDRNIKNQGQTTLSQQEPSVKMRQCGCALCASMNKTLAINVVETCFSSLKCSSSHEVCNLESLAVFAFLSPLINMYICSIWDLSLLELYDVLHTV